MIARRSAGESEAIVPQARSERVAPGEACAPAAANGNTTTFEGCARAACANTVVEAMQAAVKQRTTRALVVLIMGRLG